MRCLGTSLRLKTRWGSGYHLTIALEGRPQPLPSWGTPASGATDATAATFSPNGIRPVVSGGVVGEISVDDPHPPDVPPAGDLTLLHQPESGDGGDHILIRADRIKADVALCLGDGVVVGYGEDPPGGGGGGRLSLVVPQEDSERLLRLLDMIYESQSQLGVGEVQISLSTLEDVYLRVIQQIDNCGKGDPEN